MVSLDIFSQLVGKIEYVVGVISTNGFEVLDEEDTVEFCECVLLLSFVLVDLEFGAVVFGVRVFAEEDGESAVVEAL